MTNLDYIALWKEQEKWIPFGTDKRTAHYKSVQEFIKKGADKYYILEEKKSYSYFGMGFGYNFDSQEKYCFPYIYGLVHFKDGHFEELTFREDVRLNAGKNKKKGEKLFPEVPKYPKVICPECNEEFNNYGQEWKKLCYSCYAESQKPKKGDCKSYQLFETLQKHIELKPEDSEIIKNMLKNEIHRRCGCCFRECEHNFRVNEKTK